MLNKIMVLIETISYFVRLKTLNDLIDLLEDKDKSDYVYTLTTYINKQVQEKEPSKIIIKINDGDLNSHFKVTSIENNHVYYEFDSDETRSTPVEKAELYISICGKLLPLDKGLI